MSDKTGKLVGLILLFAVIIFIYWMGTGEADEWADEKDSQNRQENIANDIFLEKNFQDNTLLFLGQMKNKERYYDSYDIRFTSNNSEEIGDIEFTISISQGAYNFFNDIVTDKGIKNPIRIGQGKDFYECLKTCIDRYEANNGSLCDCSVYFLSYK
jgi:hypothetical protein